MAVEYKIHLTKQWLTGTVILRYVVMTGIDKQATWEIFLNEGFVACWNSEKLIWIRKQLAQGKRGGVCASCSNPQGTKFGAESVAVWKM